MKVNMQNYDNRTENSTSGSAVAERSVRTKEKSKDAGQSVNVSFSAGESFSVFGDMGVGQNDNDKKKTLTDIQQEAAFTDVGISQDYMTVVSHTMSDEDFKRMCEEGFHFETLDPDDAVNILDKIKAELVRSGQEIIGYTDDLDIETLTKAVGSESLARALSDSFRDADIPLTKENIAAVGKAWTMASELGEPTEGAYQYMIDNELEPEIWDFYMAKNSGADNAAQHRNPASEDMSYLEDKKIRQQIDQVLEQAGYECNDENREAAEWLLRRRLPLTEESIARFKRLHEAEVPVTEERFAQAAASAVAAGKDPIHADLKSDAEENIYKKAVDTLNLYRARYDAVERPESRNYGELEQWLREQDNLTARKQLEEIRLRMTAEVNVKLLKSGFAIDTAPMEELIEALRKAEEAVAQNYFPDDAQAVLKYENWNETNDVMRDMPELPAKLLGTVRIHDGDGQSATILEDFHDEGVSLKQDYDRAGQAYESLMTEPRADLGDSIRKAFGNVDELIRELGLEPTEENRRVVRILGYNNMEITEDNLNRVKEADEQVRTLIEKMTPAATLKMIRDGINPLEQSFAKLNEYFDSLPAGYQEQAESYSRYLYGLEHNKQITEQERESYIGIYRLLHQIEHKDGAAVGAVINTQAELQFDNLLSAVRSGKFQHMDVRATDELGVLKELVRDAENKSISEQIYSGYEKERLTQIRQIAEIDESAADILERCEMPVNAENLLAAKDLTENRNNPFKMLRRKSEELWRQLSDKESFQEQYDNAIEEMKEDAEELTFEQAQTSLDVREMQLTHRQLSIMGNLARNEEYVLPMYVGDEMAAVHLTIDRQGADKGSIFIAVDIGEDEHLEAHLQVKNGKVDGFLLGKTSEEVMKLEEASDIFHDLIKEDSSLNLEAVKLPVVSRGNINMTGTSENGSQGDVNSPDNGTLYHVAKLFLQAIR